MTIEESRPVVGIVLAAGRGERLRPLTDHWAKPALPFLNRPLLTWSLDALARAGVRDIGINAWHLADQVVACAEAWARAQAEPPRLTFAIEAQLLGTGGGARGVWERLGSPDATAAVLNGDAVTDVALGPHLAAHWRSGRAATLLLAETGEGGVWVDWVGEGVRGLPGPSGAVRGPDAVREASFVGVSLLEPAALAVLPRSQGCLLRQGLTPHLLDGGQVAASFSRAVHADVGSPARYAEAMRQLMAQWTCPDAPPPLPAGTEVHEPVWLDPTVRLDGPAKLGPWLVAGGGTRIAAGCDAEEGVVWGSEVRGRFGRLLRVGASEIELVF